MSQLVNATSYPLQHCPMGKAADYYLSHLELAQDVRKPYVLVSGITSETGVVLIRRW